MKKWQKSNPQKSLETWRKLSEANSELEVQLNMLSKLAEEHWDAYTCIIENCSRLRSDKVSVELIFLAPLKEMIQIIPFLGDAVAIKKSNGSFYWFGGLRYIWRHCHYGFHIK